MYITNKRHNIEIINLLRPNVTTMPVSVICKSGEMSDQPRMGIDVEGLVSWSRDVMQICILSISMMFH